MTTSYKEFNEMKTNFFSDNNFDYTIKTSDMINNKWHKEYVFSNGSIWYENYEIIDEEYTKCLHGLMVKSSAKFLKTEYWSSKDTSNIYYELY